MDNNLENLDTSLKLQPVILSGGKGSRLWPLSRECFPKQYLELDEKNDFSLLQNTYLRLKTIKNLEPPIIICLAEDLRLFFLALLISSDCSVSFLLSSNTRSSFS